MMTEVASLRTIDGLAAQCRWLNSKLHDEADQVLRMQTALDQAAAITQGHHQLLTGMRQLATAVENAPSKLRDDLSRER